MPLTVLAIMGKRRRILHAAGVNQFVSLSWTRTADSTGGSHVIEISAGIPVRVSPVEVQLRHWTELLWCSSAGQWIEGRKPALRFNCNLDAVAYCVALSLRAWVVGFDASGRVLYCLDVEQVLETAAGG
jgi:hypothetical protein